MNDYPYPPPPSAPGHAPMSTLVEPAANDIDLICERLREAIGTADALCMVSGRCADRLLGEIPSEVSPAGSFNSKARPGGVIGEMHDLLDELNNRTRGIDFNLTRLSRL